MICILKQCGMSKLHREKTKTIRSCIFLLLDVSTDLAVSIELLQKSSNYWVGIAMISFIMLQNVISFCDLLFNNKRSFILSIFGLFSFGIMIEAFPILKSENMEELQMRKKRFMFQRGHEILFEAIPNICLQLILIINLQNTEINALNIISIIFSLISIGRGFAMIDTTLDDLQYLGTSWQITYALFIVMDFIIRFIPLCLFFNITQYYPYSIVIIIILFIISLLSLIFCRFEEEWKSQKSNLQFLKNYRHLFESSVFRCIMTMIIASICAIPSIATGYMMIAMLSIFFHWIHTPKKRVFIANFEFIIRYFISIIIMILWFIHQYNENQEMMINKQENDNILFSITTEYVSFGNIYIPNRLMFWSFIVSMATMIQITLICVRKCCCIRFENMKYTKKTKVLKSLQNVVVSQSQSKQSKQLQQPQPTQLMTICSSSINSDRSDGNSNNDQESPTTPTTSVNCPV